jgi:hypothetical protein
MPRERDMGEPLPNTRNRPGHFGPFWVLSPSRLIETAGIPAHAGVSLFRVFVRILIDGTCRRSVADNPGSV